MDVALLEDEHRSWRRDLSHSSAACRLCQAVYPGAGCLFVFTSERPLVDQICSRPSNVESRLDVACDFAKRLLPLHILYRTSTIVAGAESDAHLAFYTQPCSRYGYSFMRASIEATLPMSIKAKRKVPRYR